MSVYEVYIHVIDTLLLALLSSFYRENLVYIILWGNVRLERVPGLQEQTAYWRDW